MRRMLAARAVLLAVLAGCSGPTINLSTPRPLEVDVTLRADIYQHGAAGAADGTAAATPEAAEERRRARMGEIQTLKNSRLVGENRYGLLSVIEVPPGEYGAYVQRVVAEENADRLALMKQLAAERREALASVEAEQARLWRARAFPGEWIEEPQADGTWRWVQKDEAGTTPGAPEVPPSSPPAR